MTTIEAHALIKSVSDHRIELTTIQARYPKCFHGEAKTHRLIYIADRAYEFLEEVGVMDERDFSRNASSSRAIPINRLIEDVMRDPYIPIHWGKNQPGMQALEECTALISTSYPAVTAKNMDREYAWLKARDTMVAFARGFAEAGYHKQIINRLLEPWAHINVLMTATNWSNFLALRDHKAAQPEIEMLAKAVRAAVDGAEAVYLKPGEWHMPFVLPEERAYLPLTSLQSLSVARCARLSYLTHDARKPDFDEDMKLFQTLRGPPLHASPFEHQATPDEYERGALGWQFSTFKRPHLHGNIRGYCQFRKMLPGECQ